MLKGVITSFLISFFLSLFLTPLIKRFAIAKRYVVAPREDRWHKKETALFGGVAIFLSFLFTYLIFSKLTFERLGVIICATLIFGLGLFDDIFHIKPSTKLIGQIIVASLLVTFGVSIKIIPYEIINIGLTVFWIVSVVNAFNLLDNMDGLSVGIGVIVGTLLFIFSFLNKNLPVALSSLVLTGSLLGFLRYNFNPAQIFMGDCGSMFIGFMFAAMTIESSWLQSTHLAMTLAIPVLVLFVPILDTGFVTIMRGLAARGIFHGGKDHISHRMVVLGLSEKNTVLTLYFISIFFGGVSILSLYVSPIITVMLILIALASLIYFAAFMGKVKVYSAEKIEDVKKKNGSLILNNVLLHKRRILEVGVDFILICVTYISAYLLKFEGVLSIRNQELIVRSLPIVVIIKYIVFFKFGLYRGIWRYISIGDLINIFKAVSFSSLASAMVLLFIWRFESFSRAVFIIDWLLLFMLISGSRIIERIYKELFDQVGLNGKRVLIYGAGNAGEIVLREIKNNRGLHYKPIGFLDDDKEKVGRRIHGFPVLGSKEEFVSIIKRNEIDEIIVAIPSLSKSKLDDIVSLCRNVDIGYKRLSDILPK